MLSDIAQENRLFSKKSYLDTLTFPSKIIGRQDKAKELVRLFWDTNRSWWFHSYQYMEEAAQASPQ